MKKDQSTRISINGPPPSDTNDLNRLSSPTSYSNRKLILRKVQSKLNPILDSTRDTNELYLPLVNPQRLRNSFKSRKQSEPVVVE